MNRGLSLICAALLLECSAAASPTAPCQQKFNALKPHPGLVVATEIYGGKKVSFKWVSTEHPAVRHSNGAPTISAKALDNDTADDLFIGFDSNRNHAYLVFRGNRLDGGFAVTPMVEPLRIKHNTDLLSPGIIFRVRNVSADTKENLGRILSSKDWGISYTCVRGVCGTLKEADLKVDKQLGKGSLPLITIRHLLLDGLREANGNILVPEVYLLGSDSLSKHMKQATRLDAISLMAAGTLYGTPSLIIYLGIKSRAQRHEYGEDQTERSNSWRTKR